MSRYRIAHEKRLTRPSRKPAIAGSDQNFATRRGRGRQNDHGGPDRPKVCGAHVSFRSGSNGHKAHHIFADRDAGPRTNGVIRQLCCGSANDRLWPLASFRSINRAAAKRTIADEAVGSGQTSLCAYSVEKLFTEKQTRMRVACFRFLRANLDSVSLVRENSAKTRRLCSERSFSTD